MTMVEKSSASFTRLWSTVNSILGISATQIWILIPFSLSDKKYLSSSR